jgi:hypothetical protein
VSIWLGWGWWGFFSIFPQLPFHIPLFSYYYLQTRRSSWWFFTWLPNLGSQPPISSSIPLRGNCIRQRSGDLVLGFQHTLAGLGSAVFPSSIIWFVFYGFLSYSSSTKIQKSLWSLSSSLLLVCLNLSRSSSLTLFTLVSLVLWRGESCALQIKCRRWKVLMCLFSLQCTIRTGFFFFVHSRK